MLDLSLKQLPQPLKKHQLNNEGCKCKMCQKLAHEETMKIVVEPVYDYQSQRYETNNKEYYLRIVNKMVGWEGRTRKIRFMIPEICVYEGSQPVQLFIKKAADMPVKSIRDKSKMHMFQIMQFFLQGFVLHNPTPCSPKKTHRKAPTSFATSNNTEKYKHECIVMAKYRNNAYKMLTLTQMEGLFKSRQKYMRDGLMYLQTLVGTREYCQVRVNVNLRDAMKGDTYERARTEVRIIYEEIKSSDMDYINQKQQIAYQNELKSTNIRSYLEYLTLKLILALSKPETTIISQAVFKYVQSGKQCYLIDVRVSKVEPSQQFWASAAMKAFEYKLARRMSMMDPKELGREKLEIRRYGNSKALNLSLWLEKSTEVQWDEMRVIRTRLERLEKEKKSLMESQSMMAAKSDMTMAKSFKIRSMSKH